MSETTQKPKVLYIAGPYSAKTREEIQQNINIAEQVGKAVLKAGFVPLIPHRISAHWDDDPEFDLAEWDHAAWLDRFCLPLLEKCDGILMIDGWQLSKGATIEFEHACRMDKLIHTMETLTGK